MAAKQPITSAVPAWLRAAAAAVPIGGATCIAVLSTANSMPCMAEGAINPNQAARPATAADLAASINALSEDVP